MLPYIGMFKKRFMSYTSPLMLIASISLLIAFSNLNISRSVEKIVRKISPLTFGIYIFHCQTLIYDFIIAQRFTYYTSLKSISMIFLIFFTATCIFIVSAFVDEIRMQLFNKIRINERLNLIDEFLLKKNFLIKPLLVLKYTVFKSF